MTISSPAISVVIVPSSPANTLAASVCVGLMTTLLVVPKSAPPTSRDKVKVPVCSTSYTTPYSPLSLSVTTATPAAAPRESTMVTWT